MAGSIGRPASRTIVRSPFSVSSLAAQPPEIPDPTTIASYVVARMREGESGRRREGHVAVVAVEEHPRLENVSLHPHRREIAVHGQRLDPPERVSGACL